MPTYVYRCQQCGAVIERRQSFSDAPLTVCETCGGELRKILQPVGIIFKGSGFYSTDYKNGSSSKAAETKSNTDDHGHSHGPDTHTHDSSSSTSSSSSSSSDSGSSSTPSTTPSTSSKSD